MNFIDPSGHCKDSATNKTQPWGTDGPPPADWFRNTIFQNQGTNTPKLDTNNYIEELFEFIEDTISFLAKMYENDLMKLYKVDSADIETIEWLKVDARIRATAHVYGIDPSDKMLYGGFNNPWETALQLYSAKALGELYAKSNPYFNDKPTVRETYTDKVGKPTKGTSKATKGACFITGTLTLTKDGHKPIEKIKVGDEVFSENPETGEKGLKKVVKTFVHDKDTLLNVYIGKTKIETTEEHPFWVVDKGWVLAGKLKVGDKLLLNSHEIVETTKLELVYLEKPVKVYNFEVEDWHTYFVSGVNVLVHNKAAKYNPPTPINPKKVDAKYLKKNGVDPHSLKYDTLGDGAEVSKYNIYVDKSGELWLQKNGSKEFIPTYESIGR